MSALDSQKTQEGPVSRLDGEYPLQPEQSQPEQQTRHGGHGHWMMIACCIPMLAIAIALAATGVVGAGFIVVAVGCTLMMAAMMAGMSHGGGGDAGRKG